MKPEQVISYLRDCHEADNREASIYDLTSKSITHLHFLRRANDFLAANLDVIPMVPKIAQAARKSAVMNRTEKSLIVGAFPVTGRFEIPGRRSRRIFAPLVWFPAEVLTEGDFPLLEVDRDEQRLNVRLVRHLLGTGDDTSARLNDFLAAMPHGTFGKREVDDLCSLMQEFLPRIETEPLRHFPEPAEPASIRGAIEGGSKELPLTCHPAGMMALIPNSRESRGVLTELETLSESRPLSRPLQALLSPQSTPGPTPSAPQHFFLPAALSNAQKQALNSASIWWAVPDGSRRPSIW